MLLGTSPIPTGSSGAQTFSSLAIDGATDTLEWVFQLEESVLITHVGFRPTLRTGTPPTLETGLMGQSSGIPDGTFKGGGSPASATFTPPASTAWNATWQWVALANAYQGSPGESLTSLVRYSSGTVDGSNNLSIASDSNGFHGRVALPYAIQNNAGSRTRSGQLPIFGYKSASKSYGFPFSVFNATAYSSDSSPNERALAFTIPYGMGSSFTIRKVRLRITTPAAAKNLRVDLYEGTSVLQTTGTLSSDNLRVNAQDSNILEAIFTDTTLAVLRPGTVYRVSLIPMSTASNIALVCAQANNAQDAAINGNGNYYLSTRAGAAWTDDLTQRPLVDVYLDTLVDGVNRAAFGSGLSSLG